MTGQIFKVCKPVMRDSTKWIIYNKARTVFLFVFPTDDLRRLVGKRKAAYFYGTVAPEDIKVLTEAIGKGW